MGKSKKRLPQEPERGSRQASNRGSRQVPKRGSRQPQEPQHGKRRRKKKRNIFVRLFKFLLVLMFCAVLYVGIRYGSVLVKYKNMAEDMVAEGGQDVFTDSLTTIVHDADGNELMELSSGKSTYYLPFDEIPYMARQIFITVEDRKFYEHPGIDVFAVGRAAVALVKNKGEVTQGGSTITQQLVRNIYLSHEVSAERKLKEMFIAWELEKKYSKDEILEFYINDIYFANGYYGLEAASRGYFGRSAGSLSLSELAFVCSVPNNPTLYDPLTNFENTVKRRDRVLKQLYELGCINQDTYRQAIGEEIVLCVDNSENYYNYVETYVRYCATVELMRLDGFHFRYSFENDEDEKLYDELYSEKYSEWNKKLFTEGYQIYTSIDLALQEKLQSALDTNLAASQEKNEEGVYSFQGSATCIDNSTGYVCAIVGGRSQPEFKGYTLNRAYQSFRQPGSAIKPILVYAPLFERDFTPESMVKDEKTEDGPSNSDKMYAGELTVREALRVSKNTVPWHYFDELGYATCIRYLLNMNFSHIVQKDYTPAMSIGGMTYGVSSAEMAAAYATIANQGIYRIPTCIIRIQDKNGVNIYDDSTHKATARQIYDANATLMLTDCLKTVQQVGTAKKYPVENAICAAKTGTTNENRDVWLVGYSKYYTTAVWCGYDMPKQMDGELSKSAGNTWSQYMDDIHAGMEIVDFEPYHAKEEAVDESSGEEGGTLDDEGTAEPEVESEEGGSLNTEGENGEDETSDEGGMTVGNGETPEYKLEENESGEEGTSEEVQVEEVTIVEEMTTPSEAGDVEMTTGEEDTTTNASTQETSGIMPEEGGSI